MTLTADLRRDIAPFVDPATELKITEGGHGLRLQLVRNGTEHDYFISLTDQSITGRHVKGKKFAGIKSLLASPEFADIRGFAGTQVRMFRNFDVDALIPPEGQIDGDPVKLQTLTRRLTPKSDGNGEATLSVVLLDGPAGVGKTSLIQRLLVQRARRATESAAPPILHVASRGRRLTGLDDALAQSIQIVRASFTFDQVPVLVRHSLLQLAIDGFDELVDPEGYKDAWYALRDFFDATVYGGPVILAGRDTFFDQQSFERQMNESKHRFQMTHVRLSPVSPSIAREWLRKQGWSDKDLQDPYTNIVFRPGSYALRPYFLSEMSKAKSWSAIESSDLSARGFLLESFIKREGRLICEQLGIKSEDINSRLVGLFQEIALEMADNEADSVDLAFLQLVTEVAFAGLLDSGDLAKLKHKAGSFALLETDAREGYRRFPHTEISNHFLALGLIQSLRKGMYVRFLRRGAVSADLLAIFAEQLLAQPQEASTECVDRIEKSLNEEASFDRLPENLASLLITALCRPTGVVKKYQDLQVPDVVLFGAIGPATLEKLKVQRLDAREAELSQVNFVACEVFHLTADETTRFGHALPRVHQLNLILANGRSEEMFDPGAIGDWLAEHASQIEVRAVNKDAVRLFEKVCRIMLRQHMIKEHEGDFSGKVLQDEYWKRIEQILFDHKFLDRITGKPTSGAPGTFLRMKDPYRLLTDRAKSDVKAVWTKIEAIPSR